MNIIQFYKQYQIDFLTEGHKHCQPGWVNTPCPFCVGNPGYHLGYNIEENYFYCWRCGWHSIPDTVMKLVSVNIAEAFAIIKAFEGGFPQQIKPKPKPKQAFKIPSNVGKLKNNHIRYLKQRNFNHSYLEKVWKIQGTGIISLLNGIDYSHRIFIPIFWNGEIVSFQTRSLVTYPNKPKYKNCPVDIEKIPLKSILYGQQEFWKRTGIIVEGVFDVWRFGLEACCTFGIEFTNNQIRQISKYFDKVFICFDPEPTAQSQAKKLAGELEFRNKSVEIIQLKTDPGAMPENEIRYLKKQIL